METHYTQPTLRTTQILGLLASLGICFAAAGIGAWFTISEIPGWYTALKKPTWNPPNDVFGPVWNTLYLMMAVAAWWVWRSAGFSNGRVALATFGAQLVLNTLWSILFFGLHRPDWAFIEIVVLWIAIGATIYAFAKISRLAAGLLVPYWLWVAFAAVLNYQIWRLNA
ncbi:MAG: TspO/MBR family protein [Pirellulales bacterium]